MTAVLLNPPAGDGSRTHANVRLAADCLACDVVRIVNLFPIATKDAAELSLVAHDARGWIQQRATIAAAIKDGDEVLFGWGVSSLGGVARPCMQDQIDWVISELRAVGGRAWVVGDGPRHPSRWHQYLSDRHGRTAGGSMAERIQGSLVAYQPQRLS